MDYIFESFFFNHQIALNLSILTIKVEIGLLLSCCPFFDHVDDNGIN